MSVFGHKLSKYAVVPMRAAECEADWVCCAKGNVCQEINWMLNISIYSI